MIAASLNAVSASRYWVAGGWTMLHFLWIGLAIGVFTLLVRQALDRARADVRHGCVLFCFLALAIAPAPIYRWVLAKNAPSSERSSIGAMPAATDLLGRAVARAGGSDGARANGLPFKEISGSRSTARDSTGGGVFGPFVRGLDEIAIWLPVVWVTGVPLMLLMFMAGLVGAQRLREQADRLVGERLVERLDRLCLAMGVRRGRVTLAVSRAVRAPILVGLFKPMILLPVSLVSELTPQQLELILVHELAHVRRWDNLINMIQRVAEGLLFFHPAVWVVSRWLRLEREHCCDAIVLRHVDRPRMYVQTLASLATPESGPRNALAAMANQQLVSRVRRILRPEDRTMCVSRKTLAGGVAAVMVLAAWIGMALADDAKPERASVGVAADVPAGPVTPAVDAPPAQEPAAQPPQPGRNANYPRRPGAGVDRGGNAGPARETTARLGDFARVRNDLRLNRATNGLTRDDVMGGAGDFNVTFDRIAPVRLRVGEQVDRPWGPEQATGAPNVPTAADDGRAWASLSPDGQDEWLELRYNNAVETSDILIYESFNPGAVSEVIVTDDKGAKYRVFQGKDPSAGTDMAVLVVTLAKPMRVSAVRLEIASTKAPGWNEIDAVGLVDAASGKVSWADSAKASSTYAEPAAPPQAETEMEKLRKEIMELRRQLEEQQKKKAQREAI